MVQASLGTAYALVVDRNLLPGGPALTDLGGHFAAQKPLEVPDETP